MCILLWLLPISGRNKNSANNSTKPHCSNDFTCAGEEPSKHDLMKINHLHLKSKLCRSEVRKRYKAGSITGASFLLHGTWRIQGWENPSPVKKFGHWSARRHNLCGFWSNLATKIQNKGFKICFLHPMTISQGTFSLGKFLHLANWSLKDVTKCWNSLFCSNHNLRSFVQMNRAWTCSNLQNTLPLFIKVPGFCFWKNTLSFFVQNTQPAMVIQCKSSFVKQ